MAAPGVIGSNAALPAAAARSTINIDTAGQVPKEKYGHTDTIYEINMESTPFTVLLRELGSEQGWDDTWRWYQDQRVPQSTTLDGSVPVGEAGAAGIINVAAGTGVYYTVQDCLYIHSVNAQAIVTAIAVDAITVQWVVAPLVPALDGAAVMRIGNAYEQVSVPNRGPTTLEDELFNYFQQMEHSVSASFMNVHGRYRTKPGDWEYQQEKKLHAHQIEKEKTLIFGQRVLWGAGITGGSPLGTLRGLYYWITTNVTNVGAALTQAAFDTFLEGVMIQNTHPGQDWWLLCSSRIHRQISQWYQAMEREQSSQTLFGTRVMNYRAPSQKDVKLVVHPIFDTEGFDDLGILINMGARSKAFRYVFHSVFDTKKYDIRAFEATGLTALEILYLTIFSLQVCGEWVNTGILEGVV